MSEYVYKYNATSRNEEEILAMRKDFVRKSNILMSSDKPRRIHFMEEYKLIQKKEKPKTIESVFMDRTKPAACDIEE